MVIAPIDFSGWHTPEANLRQLMGRGLGYWDGECDGVAEIQNFTQDRATK